MSALLLLVLLLPVALLWFAGYTATNDLMRRQGIEIDEWLRKEYGDERHG